MYAIRSYYVGVIIPEKEFIEGVRKLCDENQTLLIFDEVMTGFRLARGGAQEILGITPDLTVITSYSIHYTKLYEGITGESDLTVDKI